ncbi:hypothetical protein HMPREF0525_01525, partial [Lactobacillus jensenii 27-2-CHN]
YVMCTFIFLISRLDLKLIHDRVNLENIERKEK